MNPRTLEGSGKTNATALVTLEPSKMEPMLEIVDTALHYPFPNTLWGLYVRISRDREGGGLGVARQERDCRAFVTRIGGEVVRVYVDNDASQYKAKRRPGYEEMWADAEAGVITGVLSWHMDRITRTPAEMEMVIDRVNAMKLDIATATGAIDVSTPMGRLMVRQMGSIARYEVEHRSERIKSKKAELAEQGLSHGGKRPFGYDKTQSVIVEEEAEVIREMASRILAGESQRSIVADLNERGVTTSTGHAWRSTVMRRILINPRNAGRRVHQGVVVGDAAWPAILDEVTLHRLRAVLLDPTRRDRYTASRARTHLLTGIAFCGLCGAKLRSRPSGGGIKAYVCAKDADLGGCGKIKQFAAPIEEYVATLALARVADPVVLRELSRTVREVSDEALARIAADLDEKQQRLRDLGEDYANGDIERIAFRAASERLKVLIGIDQDELAKSVGLAAVPVFDVDDLAEWWNEPGTTFEKKHAFLSMLIEKIIVNPARIGLRRFDEERVQILWR